MAGYDPGKSLVTIDLSDIINANSEDSKNRRRLSSASTSSGLGSSVAGGVTGKGSSSKHEIPLTSDFSSGLHLPKLPLSREKFRNSNPNAEKLPKTPFLPRVVQSPKKSSRGGNMWRGPASSDSSDDEVDETMKKVKGFLNKRRTLAPNKMDTELRSRISKAYDTMKTLEKGVKTFDESLLLAKGRAAAAASGRSKASPKSDSVATTPRSGGTSTPQRTPRKPMKHIDLSRPVKSMFGFDQMKVLALSDDEDDEVDAGTDYIAASSPRESLSLDTMMSEPIDPTLRDIPAVADKRFLNRHFKRERRLTKELNGMKNQLEVLNMRTESEARRHKLKRVASVNIDRPRNLTRLMAYDPSKGPAKELTDYLQSTGGTTGGWDHDDHLLFRRSYTKWKHHPSKILDYVSNTSGKKLEEVAKHLTWFEKYEKLNKANQAYVRQWQIDKRREHETMFQMAAQNHRAQIEGQKSRQEMIRAKREEEKERERFRLNTWKKSQSEVKKKTEIKDPQKPEGPKEIAKLAEGLKASKERVMSVVPSSLHKVLAKTTSASSTLVKVKKPSTAQVKVETPKPEPLSPPGSPPASSRASSGIFSDQEVDSDYEKELDLGFGDMSMAKYNFVHSDSDDDEGKVDLAESDIRGGGDSAQVKLKAIREKASNVVGFSLDNIVKNHHQQRGANKKVIAMYQAKDAAMIQAKRKAILDKKERQRNKSYLSSDEAKQRIGKIDIPSHVLELTKGLKMRKNVRALDIVEAAGREAKKNDKDIYHNVSRVPSPQMFQAAPNIKLIPKLGATGWRQY